MAMTHPDPGSADAILDAIRDRSEWDDPERAREFDRLVAQFEPDRLAAAVRGRLHDLRGHDGEAILHLLDALDDPALWDELARALVAQPDLPAERAWEALALLEDAGLLEQFPELAERWAELTESLSDAGSIEELAAQIEADRDGVWLALQGMSTIEPEVRAQIIAELAGRTLGPGLIELLRLLAHAHEPVTRSAALDALGNRQGRSEPALIHAWTALATDHPDPEVAARASRWLGTPPSEAMATGLAQQRRGPHIIRSLITALDGHGQGTIVLAAEQDGEYAAAAYLCDVERGVHDLIGQIGPDPASCDSIFEDFAAAADRDAIEAGAEPALRLLGGSLMLCGKRTPPVLRFWLERTAGPGFRPRPIAEVLPVDVPAIAARADMPHHARRVLASCPSWVDDSSITRSLSDELAVRYGQVSPDPLRDEGLYRHLFAHRLQGRLEFYRRMLSWMAVFWTAAGDPALGQSALTLACHLADPENAVPSHPFLVELTTASLLAASQRQSRS